MTDTPLPTWRELIATLHGLSEPVVLDLLVREQEQAVPRSNVLVRLHQRYTILRGKRERAEIMWRADGNPGLPG